MEPSMEPSSMVCSRKPIPAKSRWQEFVDVAVDDHVAGSECGEGVAEGVGIGEGDEDEVEE